MPNGFRSAWLHKLCSAARRIALIGTGNEPGWSPAPAISRHILRRNPDIGRRRRRLPAHGDRNPPARNPRSEKSRVGKAGGSTCRYWGSTYNKTKNNKKKVV